MDDRAPPRGGPPWVDTERWSRVCARLADGRPLAFYVRAGVWRCVVVQARRAALARRETMGILTGTVSRWKDELYAVARGTVTGPLAATATRVEFERPALERTVEAVMKRARAAPGTTIVGWYHSHLDAGCAPSPTDVATHRDWFPVPYESMLIVDPVREESSAWHLDGEAKPRERLFALAYDGGRP